MVKTKSVIIKFRVSEPMNQWIESIVKNMQLEGFNVTKSSLCRTVMEYYYGSFLLDMWGKPVKEVKEKFHEFLAHGFLKNENEKESN